MSHASGIVAVMALCSLCWRCVPPTMIVLPRVGPCV
jgi:hypothetical protein